MRTTLNIDDDLLIAVKEISARESKSAGAVIPALLRQSLVHSGRDTRQSQCDTSVAEFGFRPIPKRGAMITNELIDRLREETGT